MIRRPFVSRGFTIPIYVPKEEIEHAKEVAEKTARAAANYDKWWKFKPCACGCGLTTVNTYVYGHNTPFRDKLHAKLKRARELPFSPAELAEARKNNGYTQEQLAKKLNLSKRQIRFYEKGGRVPFPEQVKKLQELFPSLRR